MLNYQPSPPPRPHTLSRTDHLHNQSKNMNLLTTETGFQHREQTQQSRNVFPNAIHKMTERIPWKFYQNNLY